MWIRVINGVYWLLEIIKKKKYINIMFILEKNGDWVFCKKKKNVRMYYKGKYLEGWSFGSK